MSLGPRTDEQHTKAKYRMYREPGEDSTIGGGLLAAKNRALLPSSRLSHQPNGMTHDSSTPTSNLRKAADLVAQMNANTGAGVLAGPQYVSGLKLPRIQSSRQSQLCTGPYS